MAKSEVPFVDGSCGGKLSFKSKLCFGVFFLGVIAGTGLSWILSILVMRRRVEFETPIRSVLGRDVQLPGNVGFWTHVSAVECDEMKSFSLKFGRR